MEQALIRTIMALSVIVKWQVTEVGEKFHQLQWDRNKSNSKKTKKKKEEEEREKKEYRSSR